MANSLKSLVKTGFGLGLGFYAVQVLFLLFGLAFFLPGYSMFQKATQEKKDKVVPFVLMTVGVVIMGGAGLGILADSLSEF
jgi:hypothetical protein